MKQALLFLLFTVASAYAAPQFADEAQNKQYYTLIHEIRCPTCQNQNIGESDAPLARQLREQIEEQIRAGRSNREITDFLIERYGDFITYAPPFAARTLILWLLPLSVMGGVALWWLARKGKSKIQRNTLNEKEKEQLAIWIERYRSKP